nr:uncharacterized protein LOC109167433 [Ipomoea batatas]
MVISWPLSVNGPLRCPVDPHLVKDMACREALSCLKGKNICNVHLESACSNVVRAILKSLVDFSYAGEPDDNTEQPDTRSPEAITNPQPTSEEESESDNDQDQFLMASQNPFTIFFTSEDRLSLARKIVQGISDFNPAACAKIALTFALNPSLIDDLTMKDSRRIMELAKLCSEVPWNLPESAVLDPEQSAPPTHALAEPRTTDAAPAASAVAAQSVPAPTIVAAQSAPAIFAGQSATASADVAAQSATASVDVAAQSATVPPDVAPMPQIFAQLLPHAITEPGSSVVPAAATLEIIAPPSASSDSFAAAAAPSSTSQLFSTAQTHVQNAMSSAAPTDCRVFAPHGNSVSSQFEFADGVFPMSNKQKATSFELSCVGSQAATINAVVTNIPSANINVLPSDK